MQGEGVVVSICGLMRCMQESKKLLCKMVENLYFKCGYQNSVMKRFSSLPGVRADP